MRNGRFVVRGRRVEARSAGFTAGLMVIAGNPKAILFYMGVLPGFFDFRTLTALDVTPVGITPDGDWVRERLAPFKAPKSVVFLDELPKGGTGKLQKQALREWH